MLWLLTFSFDFKSGLATERNLFTFVIFLIFSEHFRVLIDIY